MILFLAQFILLQDTVKNESTSTVIPFMKVETIGVSPLDESQKIFYKRAAGDKIVREFKQTPVYIITYEKNGDKLTSKLKQVGIASCVFFTENNWLSASIDVKTKIPEGYVLRAHTVAKKNATTPDKILEVHDAEVIEFYLKPADISVKFK